jgi:tRNA pseudouridine32 synthase/23S rRNA pseudouridine746 synthase
MPTQIKLNESYTVEVLFEDEDLISVNKPTGLASITENDIEKDSLHSLLETKLGQKLFVVHRLDKEVSGIILYAKNSATHKIINRQFNERTIKKFYIALAHGIVKENDGVIKKPIREFGSGRMGVDERKGKSSETRFHVIERFKDFTLLELNPTTGRRHQLRVHLYSIGRPIVGDLRYGDKTVQEKFPRIMLHAKSIGLNLPSNKSILIEAPIPDSFKKVLVNIRS